jgi:hypothetical protein
MNQRPTIREQIDACRPDSDDLHLPEHAADLAELQASFRDSGELRSQWDQSQAESRVIRAAMHDVSWPAGLEARLLAAVQAAEFVPTLSGVEQAAKESVPAEVLAAPAKTPGGKSRRRFFAAVSGLAAAAAVVIFGVVGYRSLTQTDQPIPKEQFVSLAEEWLRSVDVRALAKPAKLAPPSGFVRGTVIGSKSFSPGSEKVTAYAVQLRRGGTTAILLEIPTTRVYPVNSLPYSMLRISGGWKVGAWQRDGVLYVIAVPENADTKLDQFVPQQPIG